MAGHTNMAQTGFTPISNYYSATATNVPTAGNLVAGELAINTADGKLFYKDSSGVVQTIASKAGNINVSSFSGGSTGLTPNTATTGAVTLAGTLAVANGGTGSTTLTANNVLLGNGTSALQAVAPGTSGNLLTSNGTTWTSAAGAYALTSGTAVASTSGTSIVFTNIPSWVKRITVMLQGISTNGSSDPLVRLGTSGGIVTSGYLGTASGFSNSVATSNYTAGFGLYSSGSWGAPIIFHGIMTICLINGNSWVENGNFARSDGANGALSAGSIALAGALTQLSITTAGGTDAFDAGTINILYE